MTLSHQLVDSCAMKLALAPSSFDVVLTGKKARHDRRPEQTGDVPVTYAAVEKAERILGFRARVPLERGLAAAVAWRRSQPGERRREGA